MNETGRGLPDEKMKSKRPTFSQLLPFERGGFALVSFGRIQEICVKGHCG